MVLDHRGLYIQSAKALLTKITTPLQYAAAWPHDAVTGIADNIVSYRFLKSENQRLAKENFLARVQLQKFQALVQENNQLRQLLNTSLKNQTHRILVAQTLAVDADFFTHQMLIDKGSKHGVYVGQAVLDEDGVMGQVIQTTPLSSRILLISDARSAVPVQNYRTGMRGIIAGTGSQNNLSLIHVPITADVRMGDLLLTSGLDGRYPAGFPVGIVRSVQHKPQEQFAVIAVAPKARLNRNQLVVLIWPNSKGNGYEAK